MHQNNHSLIMIESDWGHFVDPSIPKQKKYKSRYFNNHKSNLEVIDELNSVPELEFSMSGIFNYVFEILLNCWLEKKINL